jgi:hypothetical protein
MSNEREFRIGEVQREVVGKTVPRAEPGPGLDRDTFPTLAAFLKVPHAEFRSRLDALSARSRAESGDLQAALLAAVKVLPEMYKVYGG